MSIEHILDCERDNIRLTKEIAKLTAERDEAVKNQYQDKCPACGTELSNQALARLKVAEAFVTKWKNYNIEGSEIEQDRYEEDLNALLEHSPAKTLTERE